MSGNEITQILQKNADQTTWRDAASQTIYKTWATADDELVAVYAYKALTIATREWVTLNAAKEKDKAEKAIKEATKGL